MPLPEAVLRQYLGGSGLGAWLLLEEGEPRTDPLAAEAPLVFAFSPLVGSPLTTSAKFAVVSKSPLTDRINDSLASSGFAIAGKRCGCDAIVIVGGPRSSRCLSSTTDGSASKRPTTFAAPRARSTEATLKARLGADYQIASIGPAGEHLVRYATISHDGRHAGRGGSGAVLGSKNIKAIAVRGTQRCEWAHPRELTEYSKDLSKRSFGPATAKYRELGTATNLLTFNRLGALPTRNFQSGTFDEAASISPEQIRATHTPDARQLRRLHHRLRAHLRARRRNGRAARVREPVRARPAVRRRRRRTPCCARRRRATSWASTRSAPAARSRSPWSASNAACSTSPGSRSAAATRCCARSS